MMISVLLLSPALSGGVVDAANDAGAAVVGGVAMAVGAPGRIEEGGPVGAAVVGVGAPDTVVAITVGRVDTRSVGT
jgi:hypothetical protein